MKKNKTVYKYMTWDEQIFNNIKEGIEYDLKAFKEVCDNLLFFHYGMFDSFDNIPIADYDSMIDNMRIYHIDTIPLLILHMVGAPIIYCHTEKTAQVISGIINNMFDDSYKIKGINQGFMFFSEEAMDFLPLEKLPNNIIATPAFNKIMDTMNHFVEENL